MPVTNQEFLDFCTQQGVNLDLELRRKIRARPTHPVRRAVRLAASTIQCTPAKPLAETPMDATPWEDDTAARALRRMINTSLTRSRLNPNFIRPGDAMLTGCYTAEERFMRTIMGITGGIGPRQENGCEIFVDPEDMPIAIRKSLREKTTLSLIPMAIHGVEVPPGSILSMQCREDQPYATAPSAQEVRLRPMADMAVANFIRMSVLAFTPQERQDQFQSVLHNPSLRPEEQTLLACLSLGQLRQHVQRQIDG